MCINFGILSVYTSELFPTVFRALAINIGNSIGKFGSMISPVIINTLVNNNIQPYISYGFLGVIGLILSYLMKETFGKGLTEEIEENKIN